MHYCMRLMILLPLLTSCDQGMEKTAAPPRADSWSNEAEVIFQQAEALKYSLEEYKLEQEQIQAQGLEGRPPAPR